MKSIPVVLLALTVVGCAHTALQRTDVAVGPSLFPRGDSVTIQEVRSALGTLQEGDTVVVTGTYNLAEESEASLLLTVTRTKSKGGKGGQSVEPEQRANISGRSGAFELTIQVPCEGYLHLSLRNSETRKALGHLYFGTKAQMKEIEDWDLTKRFKK